MTATATAIDNVIPWIVSTLNAALAYPVFDGPPSSLPDNAETRFAAIGAESPLETGEETRQTTSRDARSGCRVSVFRALPLCGERASEPKQHFLLGSLRAARLGAVAAAAAEIRGDHLAGCVGVGCRVWLFRRARHWISPTICGQL